MGVLKNPRHEAFAQALVHGEPPLRAYENAGFKPHNGNAYRLRETESVSKRIAELRGRIIRRVERSLGMDFDRLTKEFARIGLANITDVLAIRDGQVIVQDTAELSEDTTAAISEIRQTREGIVLKMHDKAKALENLAKHLGYYKDTTVNLRVGLAELVTASYREDFPALPPPTALEGQQEGVIVPDS